MNCPCRYCKGVLQDIFTFSYDLLNSKYRNYHFNTVNYALKPGAFLTFVSLYDILLLTKEVGNMKIPERIPIQKNGIFTNFALTPEPEEPEPLKQSKMPKWRKQCVIVLNTIGGWGCFIFWLHAGLGIPLIFCFVVCIALILFVLLFKFVVIPFLNRMV
jgi:hypothetical protein